MAIVEEDIERVRTTLAIAEVIQPYVALRRVGRNWVGLCPFHAEKTGSFNVRDETGRYRCFGCGKAGDMFTFVQEIEHVDFVASVERLAAKAGVQLRYTTGGEGKDRQRRKRLIEAMDQAVEWYHQRLLTAADAREARDYLRSRGLSGDIARQFRIGWAPDDWDALSRGLGLPADVLKDTGLAFMNRRNKLQDAFRARVLFPIFSADGDAVALGGRVLPGSSDPAKYKNSPETAIYAKSKTFYGLNWAKGAIVATNQVVVCEGYTDVIGFHRAGIERVVATCGTALTEDHVRLLKRYASRVVLAFDADKAGQGAAERFYEWEQKYQVEVSVARFPEGQDPGDLASSNPGLLREAVDGATPFLGFRLRRVLASRRPDSPEHRSRLANEAMAVVNEHPDENVRKLYAGEVATHTGLPVADLVKVAAERRGRVAVAEVVPRRALNENAEFGAVALLLQRWDEIAPWLVEALFADDVVRRAFLALAETAGHLESALEAADPEAREVLERAAVADLDLDPEVEARNLIRAAVRRELGRRTRVEDPAAIREDIEARQWVEGFDSPQPDPELAERLLQWLDRRSEERG
ncbi:MAG: DNA primase [Acidimicrobiia bacterium]